MHNACKLYTRSYEGTTTTSSVPSFCMETLALYIIQSYMQYWFVITYCNYLIRNTIATHGITFKIAVYTVCVETCMQPSLSADSYKSSLFPIQS